MSKLTFYKLNYKILNKLISLMRKNFNNMKIIFNKYKMNNY